MCSYDCVRNFFSFFFLVATIKKDHFFLCVCIYVTCQYLLAHSVRELGELEIDPSLFRCSLSKHSL